MNFRTARRGSPGRKAWGGLSFPVVTLDAWPFYSVLPIELDASAARQLRVLHDIKSAIRPTRCSRRYRGSSATGCASSEWSRFSDTHDSPPLRPRWQWRCARRTSGRGRRRRGARAACRRRCDHAPAVRGRAPRGTLSATTAEGRHVTDFVHRTAAIENAIIGAIDVRLAGVRRQRRQAAQARRRAEAAERGAQPLRATLAEILGASRRAP